jgi:alpha-glucosidase
MLFLLPLFKPLGGLSKKKEMPMKQMDAQWWKKTVCYEIYPSSFQDTNGDGVGDLKGITSRLDYLASLGVGCIWLTPIYASPMKDNGYDVSDFYKINPLYGSMEDMENLIAEADKRNIKIVMDLVFNHVSEEKAWFQESKKSKENPKSDWFIWRDTPNNWRGIFGGSAWKWCEERKQYYLHTFGDFQPDLNWENPEVRKALYDVANFWIQKGVGGFLV